MTSTRILPSVVQQGRHHRSPSPQRTLASWPSAPMVRDGDIGFVISKRGGDIKLQAIEADRIGNGSKEGMNTPKKAGGGFVLDDDGKPVRSGSTSGR